MDKEDAAKLERMLEHWDSIAAIYRRGSIDGFVRVRDEHWQIIEDICRDWAETARAILEDD